MITVGPAKLPGHFPDQLIDTYAHVSAANQRSLERLTTVLAQFHAHGIDCLLLKGADVLTRLYGILGIRPMADVDLLVREQDLPVIDRILSNLGYRPVIDGNPAYVAPDESLVLDLATEIWYADDTDAIWKRATERTVAGLPVKSMGADDLLIYLTAYTVLHRGYFAPSFSKDIALLVGREPLDWEFILEEATRRHLKISLYHGLSYAGRHEAVSVPANVLERLAPANRMEAVLQRVLRKLVTEKPVEDIGHVLVFVSRSGQRNWQRFRHTLWPSAAFLRYRYGVRGETFPVWTRLARTLHLTIQAHRLLGRILHRLAGQH